jgi:hypothetical protein
MTGAAGYPKKFNISTPGAGGLEATAHIWPARAKSPGYKLGGGAVSRRQGFYFYRNDRLIQAGGWNNYRDDTEPHLSLARVAVDLPGTLEGFFSIRFSKSGVDAPLSFVNAVQSATSDDGTSFAAYIDRAIDVYRAKSSSAMKPVVPPGPGLRSDVRKAVKNNFPVIPRDDEVTIRWERLPANKFFEIDRESHVLMLNSVYRRVVLGDRAASKADAPIVKALLFLLLNDMFRTQRESAVEKSTIAAYQAVLVSAARGEMK